MGRPLGRRKLEIRLMPSTQFQSGAVAYNVELRQGPDGQLIADVNGQRSEGRLSVSEDGNAVIQMGRRLVPCYAVHLKDAVEVWVDGTIHRFQRSAARSRTGSSTDGHAASEILAPMPGTVLRINTHEGGAFEPHQPLIIMESMKMEITLSAPYAGRVRELHCKVGELVPMGKLLVSLAPQASDAQIPAKS